MKAFKTMGFKRGKGKRGFTLIELLIVMVILAILAGVVVMAVGGIFGQAKEQAYNTIHSQMQTAVTAFIAGTHGQQPPIQNGREWNISKGGTLVPVGVLDVCAVIGGGELLRDVPDGLLGAADEGDTNYWNVAGGGYTVCIPKTTEGHYVWVIDAQGTTYTICDEDDDGAIDNANESTDGFSGSLYGVEEIWP